MTEAHPDLKAAVRSIIKPVKSASDILDPHMGEISIRPDLSSKRNALEGLLRLKTTDEMMSKIENSKFAFKRLIVQGHICAIVAKPNGGKTTVMTYAAGKMAQVGYQVLYINVDAGAADLKFYHAHANRNGYTLLAPDMIEGESARTVVQLLEEMARSGSDLSGVVLIFDTLKKFVEVMNKSQGKVFYALIRKLTAMGATAVLLGHTNKYEDENGKPIYEGTGDLKSDIDELIYLIPVKGEDGTITVSTEVDKERAATENATFYISPSREVTEASEFVNTLEQSIAQRQLSEDSAAISFIEECIQTDCKSLTQLTQLSKDARAGFSRKRLERVLNRYSDPENPLKRWDKAPSTTSGFVYFLPKTTRGVKT